MKIRSFRSAGALALAATLGCAAHATTFNYDLNGSLAENNGGPSLVAYGGTLGPTGYSFGPNAGLSLAGTGAFDSYSIDIRFYFDSVNASFNGYQRILDFKNRTVDMGLYSQNGVLQCFACGGNLPGASTQVFFNGQLVDLKLTLDGGLFSAYINGVLLGSIPNGANGNFANFSGPDNIIYFFMDDFVSLANFPNTPEAGSGFIDSISVSQTPLPAALPLFVTGLGALGLLGWRRKREQAGEGVHADKK